jgi:hypothetical protein
LGAGKLYWSLSLVWVAGLAGSIFLWINDPKNRAEAIIFGSIFGFFLLAVILYPILRVREEHTVFQSRTSFKSRNIEGLFIPASRIALSIYTYGSLGLAVLTMLAAVSSTSLEHRLKAGLAGGGYAIVFVLIVLSGVNRKRGIFLTREGVFWSGLIHACFIPWEQIRSIGLVEKKEQYTKSTQLGLTVKELSEVSTAKLTVKKMKENFSQQSWHLSYGRDLRAPLEWVAEKIQFYLQHPERRGELEDMTRRTAWAESLLGINAIK